MQSEVIETRGDDGIGLRVEFTWRGDRFGHIISWIDNDGVARPLLESIEALGAEAWPASPPLQSLTIHALPNGNPAALLVGMAGRSHWSASVEGTAEHATLQFDIACRHSTTSEWLGSRYRLVGDLAKRVNIAPVDGQVNYIADVATIEPTTINENSPTTRWRYSVGIRLSSEL